jgi:hypothetical protein
MENSITYNIKQLAFAVERGEADPLTAFAELAKIEKVAKEAKEQIKEQAIAEAAKYAERAIPIAGVIVEKKAAAGKWDFKGIRAWSEAKANLAAIEERAKAAYQAAQKFGAITATEDGEVLELPTYQSGGETLAIKA